MNPKSEKEMFTRVAIFDTYCQTTHYKKIFKRTHTDISKIFKLYTMFRDGITANSYTVYDFIKDGNKIVEKLQDDSLVPHELGFTTARDKSISDWGLYPISKADHLPFDVTESNNSGFEKLEFDLNIGLNDQLKAAKEKLQKKQAIYKKSVQKGGKVGTSRQNLDLILENLECLVFRDNEKGSEKDVSKKFGLSYGTFRDKCNKALALIRSKEIIRFFPK